MRLQTNIQNINDSRSLSFDVMLKVAYDATFRPIVILDANRHVHRRDIQLMPVNEACISTAIYFISDQTHRCSILLK